MNGDLEGRYEMFLAVVSTELTSKTLDKHSPLLTDLASVSVHHSPDVDLLPVHSLQHGDCPDDGPVLVVVPPALHAEHGAPLVPLPPLPAGPALADWVQAEDLADPT